LQSVLQKVDAERAEVDLLLNSRTFARNGNLGRFLHFICEKYFEGTTGELKEYSIAVQALGRPPDFDPQLDTVVRVTAHNLRKRLELYYASEGADHAVQVCLPPGHYVPQFVHRGEETSARAKLYAEPNGYDVVSPVDLQDSSSVLQETTPDFSPPAGGIRATPEREGHWKFAAVIVIVCALTGLAFYQWIRKAPAKSANESSVVPASLSQSGPQIHALVGAERASFVDRAGSEWQSDRFCSGGNTFSVTGHNISGTSDPQLFLSGRRGPFKCSYPVPAGTYEVHLLFAETSGLQENSRAVLFSINGGANTGLDVVDDAGGDDTATAKVFTDVQPGPDGMIHVDFITAESFVNAIEILPSAPHRMLPVRIIAGHSAYRDTSGNVWLPDRYFFGGRLSWYVGDLSKLPNNGLYEWHRFGHFHYIIPVANGGPYTLKLYFLEHWFGAQNGGPGGVGSRVFDVSCNGSVLLKDFDIYREAGTSPLVKTFPHIEPTAQGKIELYFTPVVNYPSISAIEVVPE